MGRLIFCASPGRCGTKYLASLLDTAAMTQAFHEPEPTLAQASLADQHRAIRVAQCGGVTQDGGELHQGRQHVCFCGVA